MSRFGTSGSMRPREDHLNSLLHRAAGGDRRARDEAITAALPLARKLAARYVRPGVSIEDLVQVAAIGVVNAVDRWDPARGRSFSGFAVPTILGELRRFFRQNSWAARPARDLQELWLAAERMRDQLTGTLQRSPTVAEVADALGRPQEEVLEALAAGSARESMSLDVPTHGEDDAIPLEARVGSLDDSYLQVEDRGTLDDLMAGLPKRERVVLWLRFRHDLTQREIGEYLGVSQMHVSRLLRSSLDAMRWAHDEMSGVPVTDRRASAA